MKKIIFVFAALFFSSFVFSQEALKSIEEDYYDFMSLRGITERPTLGYRTLSDNVWKFNEITSFMENEDGTFSKVLTPGEENEINIWSKNNLGKTFTIWTPSNPAENFITRGFKQGLFVKVYGPEWFGSVNSTVPYGWNDGALWQGKGFNTSLTTGIRAEGYGFEITFKPLLCFSQNLDYDYQQGVNGSKYSYWAGGIDLVQRYGDESLFTFDWGDSEIRYSWHNLTFGFGTQNAWLGASYINPMLGSNNAPGFPKFDWGLRKTEVIIPLPKNKSLNIGSIEGRIWTGLLTESDYFDTNPDNNKRMVNGLSASYSPSFIPGFTIGLNRVFVTNWSKHNLKYILRLFTLSRANGFFTGEDEDQKFAFFAEWNLPKAGFTVYGEFGRDDFSYDEESYPFHTAIYTIGAKQFIPLPFNLKSELNVEFNFFEMSQDYQFVFPYMGYYVHGSINQGYTNKGQIIGAGTGSFGNSLFIQYKVYYPKGYTLLRFHRHSPNNNAIHAKTVHWAADPNYDNLLHSEYYLHWFENFETYYTIGMETCFFFTKDFLATLGFNYSKIYHRNYNPTPKVHSDNFNAEFRVKYEF